MKRVAAVPLGVSLAVAGGCPPVAGRLDVTDNLRQACADWVDNDAEIKAFITSAESDREAGVTKQEALAGIASVCGQWDPETNRDCMTCGTAIIGQVHGD